MKHLNLLCAVLVLCSCGRTAQTTDTPDRPLSYPYNPGRNPTEDADPRVPYYGEWAWTITFPNHTVAAGRLSVAQRVTPKAGYANASAGPAVWCPDGNACPYEQDSGLIGTTSNNESGELIVELDDPSTGTGLRFVGVDLDGVVGRDVSGRPTLTGAGVWNYDMNGHSDYVEFTLSQMSVTPPVSSLTDLTSRPIPAEAEVQP